ncbi:hypothetical protein [Paenibacillus polymyxa]|nr:hypothetical protein [Paenibacillus polymyxa]
MPLHQALRLLIPNELIVPVQRLEAPGIRLITLSSPSEIQKCSDLQML